LAFDFLCPAMYSGALCRGSISLGEHSADHKFIDQCYIYLSAARRPHLQLKAACVFSLHFFNPKFSHLMDCSAASLPRSGLRFESAELFNRCQEPCRGLRVFVMSGRKRLIGTIGVPQPFCDPRLRTSVSSTQILRLVLQNVPAALLRFLRRGNDSQCGFSSRSRIPIPPAVRTPASGGAAGVVALVAFL